MTTNIYTEHAVHTTLTDQLKESRDKERLYRIGFHILMAVCMIMFVFNGIAFVTSYKTVMTYESVCPACNYNLCLPEPVPTPIQK